MRILAQMRHLSSQKSREKLGRDEHAKKRDRWLDRPCFAEAAPTLLRGILTPSLMGTPPSALGRREWEVLGRGEGSGAGDWERGDGADVCGGPFDQADFGGSVFAEDAVEGLLILHGLEGSTSASGRELTNFTSEKGQICAFFFRVFVACVRSSKMTCQQAFSCWKSRDLSSKKKRWRTLLEERPGRQQTKERCVPGSEMNPHLFAIHSPSKQRLRATIQSDS